MRAETMVLPPPAETEPHASGSVDVLERRPATAAIALTFVEANDLDSLADRVGEATDRITDEEGNEPPTLIVITFSTDVCDRLRREIGYVSLEEGTDRSIICENVHRVPGLSFDHVVLAATSDTMTETMRSLGFERTPLTMTVVGPRALAAHIDQRSFTAV
ncbi:MAG: hypothetical protein NTZ21_09565 [Actinobacteria bacterium]|nr:hypothetical protein [Actinomycetota bacterium]